MSMQTLHVTNGDSVLYSWKKVGLLGTHLAWRDLLHDGPVFADRPLEAMSAIRAQFLASEGYANPIKAAYDFEKRDALLRRAREFEEVVLWFELDLYDQLQLLQILATVAEMELPAGTVQLIQSDTYLGSMTGDELLGLLPRRRALSKAGTASAERLWSAITAQTPQLLQEAVASEHTGFPFMRAALLRLCEEYPALESGISRTERQILEAVSQGARTKDELFRRSQAREEAVFLGDTPFYRRLHYLSAAPAPLLEIAEDGYDLTALGRRILAGDADWLEEQPLDRWIGGVHLTSERHWRWNEDARVFSERAA